MKLNKENVGNTIRQLRLANGLTQTELADKFGYENPISFQSISLWENGTTLPSIENLYKLSEIFNVSLSLLLEEKEFDNDEYRSIYDIDHMKTFIKTKAMTLKLNDTLKALPIAFKAHEGVNRKNSEVPYIYHPLSLSCRALALDIKDDSIIAACILHDVIEDAVITKDNEFKARKLTNKDEFLKEVEEKDLPVSKETKLLVKLMTHKKEDGSKRKAVMNEYYKNLSKNSKASLIKCLDRCDNLYGMYHGLSKERQIRYIKETELYIYKLLESVKKDPELNNAYFTLNYEIKNIVQIYKNYI